MHRQYSHKREKIIQWLRLTWDLRDLFLILPSATGFLYNTHFYIYIHAPWKRHIGHCLLPFKCRPEPMLESKPALLLHFMDDRPHSAKGLGELWPTQDRDRHPSGQEETHSAIPFLSIYMEALIDVDTALLSIPQGDRVGRQCKGKRWPHTMINPVKAPLGKAN